MSKEAYVAHGIMNLAQIKSVFIKMKIPWDYYFIEDKVEKSAYDTYSTSEIDDKHSPETHIMMPTENNHNLIEISKESNVIQTLSDDNKVKIISLFFPEKVLAEVNKVLNH